MVAILKKKHKVIKDILIVTGRADIGVLMQGKISEINSMVLNFRKVKDVVTTETLMEVEVNLGW